jgi:hypothetical protein
MDGASMERRRDLIRARLSAHPKHGDGGASMFGLRYVYLKPIIWSQEIRHYPNNDPTKNIEGLYLSVTCAPKANCDILLRNGAKLRDFQIQFSIVQGELQVNERSKSNLLNNAIGGLWFIEDEDFVHGWCFLRSNNYVALWDQVRDGGYVDCAINLGVEPIQQDEVWKDNPLSIVSAAIDFTHKPIADRSDDDQAARKKGWFARR